MNNRLDEWIKHTTDPMNVGSAHCQTPDMALTDGGVDLMWQLKKQEWTFHVFFFLKFGRPFLHTEPLSYMTYPVFTLW